MQLKTMQFFSTLILEGMMDFQSKVSSYF